jgi:hypothetical protein
LAGLLPRCPTKALTSYPCLLCGTTRAALALAKLDFAAAFVVNPLIALAWIVFVVGGLIAAARAFLGRPLAPFPPFPWSRIPRPLWWLLGILFLVNWVYLIYQGI